MNDLVYFRLHAFTFAVRCVLCAVRCRTRHSVLQLDGPWVEQSGYGRYGIPCGFAKRRRSLVASLDETFSRTMG